MKNKKCQKETCKKNIFVCLGVFNEANKIYPLPEDLCLVDSASCKKCTKERIKLYSEILIDKNKVDLGLLSPKDSKAHIVIPGRKKEYDVSIFSELKKMVKVNIFLPRVQTLTIGCIIHSFNNKKNIESLYDGLKNLNINEIIICEDGSSDGSKEKWEQYSKKDRRIKIICSKNIHELRCFDNAIKISSSDICCLFQGDDMIPDDGGLWFSQAKELLESMIDLSVLGGFSSINIHKIVAEDKFIREDIRSTSVLNISGLMVNEIPFAYVMGSIVGPYFVRKKSYLDFGGFEIIHDVGKPSIFHDLLFSLKIWDNNYKVGMYGTSFKKTCGSCKRKKRDENYKKVYRTEALIDVSYIYKTYSNNKIEQFKKDIIQSNLLLRKNKKLTKITENEEGIYESKRNYKKIF